MQLILKSYEDQYSLERIQEGDHPKNILGCKISEI